MEERECMADANWEIECLEAMRGIPDPTAFVREARELADAFAASVVLSEFREAREKADAFLAKHGGPK